MAVAPNARAYGVAQTGDDWRIARGEPGNDRELRAGVVGIDAPYTVTALDNALAATYPTDAHLVAYVLRDASGPLRTQPRINKSGLPFILSLGFGVSIDTLIADVDNPGHCDWTPELEAIAHAEDARLGTAGVYYTSHGRRIVQPLRRAIDVSLAEGVLDGWLASLEALGILADSSCRDWTRHFRLPHVRRAGQPYRSPRVDLDRMRPIDAPAPARRGPWGKRSARAIGEMQPLSATPLADAFGAAGWLGERLGADKSSARCPWEDTHTERARNGAIDTSTVLFGASAKYPLGYWHCSHAHCSHRSQREVIAALPASARALLPAIESAPAPVRPGLVSVGAAKATLEEAFRRAPDGLSVVIAGCGTGKTQAALVIAQERAARPHATKGEHKRAPAHSRTAISVPTTRLVGELVERLRADGASVRRVFGPLSVRRADGEPECRYHAAASAYASGGQSVPWDFCAGRDRNPCDYADVCTAAGGIEGPDDARIIVGPHALLGQLDAAAGSTGLLVVDEPPGLLSHEILTPADLLGAEAGLASFEGRYASAMRVSLRAIAAWIERGPLDAPGPLALGVELVDEHLLEEAFEMTGETDAVACAKAAFDPDHDGARVPPVRRADAFAARRSPGLAAQIGRVSRVLQIVWLGLTCDPGGVVARIEERRPRGSSTPTRVLVVTLPDVQLREALRREGAVVVADANGRIHLPVYERIVGYVPPAVEAYAADGAPVSRTLLRTRATRRSWMPSGRLEVSAGLLAAVRSVVDWACEGTRRDRLAIVTLKPLALALRAALGENVAEAWAKAGQTPSSLRALAEALRPELERLPRRPDLAHYGAIRGLDAWKDHDALATLGDPWLQLSDVAWESSFLGLDGWEQRYEALCAAELEQAHGRLRTVHRTTAARALHVGAVMPSGWLDVDVREPHTGRPKRAATMGPEDVRRAVERLGGTAAAARRLRCDPRVLRRYLSGERGTPPDVQASLIRLATSEGWSSAS